jgi:hypothetical protein
MNIASKRAQKVANDALEQAAQSGVARAIAARQAAGVELTAGDVAQVSGGAFAIDFTRAGGIPPFALVAASNPTINPATTIGSAVNPSLPAVQELGLQGLAV